MPITLGFGETLVLKDATRERAEIVVIEKHKNTNYARQNEREQAVVMEDRNIPPDYAAPKEISVHTNLGSYVFKQ